MEKKKYWLKLYEGFMQSPQMKVIRKMQNGAEYILLYISLMLESIESAGHLRFNEIIPYNDEMLASVTDTNVDIVRTGMKIFEELGMIQKLDDGTIFLPEVPKLIGKESESTQRVREWRLKNQKERELLQCNTDVTKCNSDVTKCNDNKEKDKDKNKEKEIDKEKDNNLLLLLERNYARTISELEKTKIEELQQEYSDDLILRAIQISVINNAKKLSYVTGILKNWKKEGIKSVNEITKRDRGDPPEEISNELLEYDWLNEKGVDEEC